MSEGSNADRNAARVRAAFQKLEAEIAAVPGERVVRVSLDVPTAVGTVLAKLPGLRALRPQIEKELPFFDLGRFDKLEEYALALFYAHGTYLVATQPPRSLEELATQGTALRRILLFDASAQAARGLFDEGRLNEIREGTGYRDLAADLIALVSLYRGRWEEVVTTSGIREAELERAEALAALLVSAVGERDAAPAARGAAIEQRERAFALFVQAYNDARRAVTYLRADAGDADGIAPSLYAGRRARVDGETGSLGEPPVESGLLPVSPPPASEATSATSASGAMADALPAAEPIKVGLPGAKAFTE